MWWLLRALPLGLGVAGFGVAAGLVFVVLARGAQLRQARRDPITQLPSLEQWREGARRFLRKEKSAQVVMVRLVGFDRMAHVGGRHYGADVLAAVGAQLGVGFERLGGNVCRWDGEVFLAIVPTTVNTGALEGLFGKAFAVKSGGQVRRLSMTATFGRADGHAHEVGLLDLELAADEALRTGVLDVVPVGWAQALGATEDWMSRDRVSASSGKGGRP